MRQAWALSTRAEGQTDAQTAEAEVSASGDPPQQVWLSESSAQSFTRGHVQIMTGDFNAEPDEPAYAFITGDVAGGGDFKDAWLLGQESGSQDSDGNTFPSCKPVKRIDFILLRNNSEAEKAAGTTGVVFSLWMCSPHVFQEATGRGLSSAPAEWGWTPVASPLIALG